VVGQPPDIGFVVRKLEVDGVRHDNGNTASRSVIPIVIELHKLGGS
jgi:hypothetical protein